jgi:error-prone DNA polymerase
MKVAFCHLHVHSAWSFLDGGSSLEQIIGRATDIGMPYLALTDHNTLASAVRFSGLAKEAGIKPILGAEITLDSGHHIVILARNKEGYKNLCRILTKAHLGSPRGNSGFNLAELERNSDGLAADGLIALSGCHHGEIPSALLSGHFAEAEKTAKRYIRIFGQDSFLFELTAVRLPGTRRLNRYLAELAKSLHLKTAATNNVHFALPNDFEIHDILTCMRVGIHLDDIHPERRPNAENYLKTEDEMKQVLRDYPEAITQTFEIAQACEPSLPDSADLYPSFPTGGKPPRAMLRQLVMEGAEQRYGHPSGNGHINKEDIKRRLEYELDIITRLGFEDYFLLAWDIVKWAKSKNIRYSGRGSAADSAVAYCLSLTDVDPIARGLLFERFMSLERAEPPDIDLDFDARYRDDVTAYVYEKYGKDHVATVAVYNTFRARSAVREIGKAIGLPAGELDRFAKSLPAFLPADGIRNAMDAYPESRVLKAYETRWDTLIDACEKVAGFPRFLGAHLGGIVVTGAPITDISPLQMAAKGVNIVQFDKDDIEDLGLAKLDLLSLRMLSAIEEANQAITQRHPSFDYNRIPLEGDRRTYNMIRHGETVGVFQLESPAQRALQARLGVNRFEDIVASLALIRPGPIKGNMVEPFLRRRKGKEPVEYPDPRLASILRKTYGVILFQEQVIEIAKAVAGFSAGEADRLRRVMTHSRSQQEMNKIGESFIESAIKNGTEPGVASEIFEMIRGYASYGFCEAHAASFSVLASKSAYLAEHYPAELYAGLMSCQPMGYYPLSVLAGEARRRGVPVLGPSVNKSLGNCSVEVINDAGKPRKTIRLGFRLIKDMTFQVLKRIEEERFTDSGPRPFNSIEDFILRIKPPRNTMENLILCGAFDDLHQGNRRELLWKYGKSQVVSRQPLKSSPMLFNEQSKYVQEQQTATSRLQMLQNNERSAYVQEQPDFTPFEKIAWEYRLLGIGISGHPLSPFRKYLRSQGYRTTAGARQLPVGETVSVAGLLIRPHRPPTRSGRTVAFMSLEDESGIIDVTVFEETYHRYGHLIFNPPSPILGVTGKIEKRGYRRDYNGHGGNGPD